MISKITTTSIINMSISIDIRSISTASTASTISITGITITQQIFLLSLLFLVSLIWTPMKVSNHIYRNSKTKKERIKQEEITY